MTATVMCALCDNPASLVTESRDITVGTRTVKVADHFYRCSHCGESFYRPGQMAATQRRAMAALFPPEET